MRRLLLPLLVAVLALSAWLVLRAGAGADNDPVTLEDAPLPDAPLTAGRMAPGDETVQRADAAPAPQPPAGAPGDEFLPSSEDPSALRVRCIDRESGEPLPGAIVYRLDQSGADEDAAMRAMMTGTSIPDMIARLGEAYRVGPDGEVRIPPGPDLAIAGRHEDKFRVRLVTDPAPGEVVVLDLFRQPHFTVEVVGEDGTPRPGADVAMRMFWDTWRFDVQVQPTDEHGVVRFADFATLLESAISETLFVGLSEVLPAPVETRVPDGLFEQEDPAPLRLVMPATGGVAVEVVDHLGAPCRDGVVVRLVVDEPGKEDEALGGGDGRAATALTVDGTAQFDYVGLGLPLRAAAYLNGPTTPSESRAEGPRAAGDVVRLRIEENLGGSGASGRLILAGKPYADRDVHLTLRRREIDGTWEDDFFIRTGRDGEFRAQFRPSDAEASLERVLFVEADQAGVSLLAQAALPGEFGSGFVDLGTLELEAAPTVVEGRVLDFAGTPLHGAKVIVETRVNWGNDPARSWWVERADLEASTGADGAFRIAGLPPSDTPLRVVASHARGIPARADFEIGAGVVLRLRAAGTLSGSVLADEGFPYERLEVALIYATPLLPEDEEDLILWDKVDPIAHDFRMVGLPSGTAALIVGDDDTGTELARVDNIAVGPGAPPDARLHPLDLRGRVRVHRITVRSEVGEELDGARVQPLGEEDQAISTRDGVAMLLSSREVLDLQVSGEGYRTAVLRAVRGATDVTLRRGIPVEFVWPGGPPDDGHWSVYLIPPEGTPLHSASVSTGFDPAGRARLFLPEPGTWQLWHTVYAADGTHAWVGDEQGVARRLEVADSAATQRVDVGLDADALRRAEEALTEARSEGG